MDLFFDILRFIYASSHVAYFGPSIGTVAFLLLFAFFVYRRIIPRARSSDGVFLEDFRQRPEKPDHRTEFDNEFSTQAGLEDTPSLSIDAKPRSPNEVNAASNIGKVKFRLNSENENSSDTRL